MSSRYDPAAEEPKPVAAEPTKSPLEPVSKAGLYKSLGAIVIAAAIGAAAAFNFDLCGLLAGLGVHLDACKAPAPAAVTVAPQ